MGMEIALETVCYVINRARELLADLSPLDEESGKRSRDDAAREELPEEDTSEIVESPAYNELKDFIDSLSEDEQVELVALTWIGRGTYTADDWDEAVEVAREEHSKHTGVYLLGQPLLAEELEEGLSEFGLSCEDVE
ncbi:MAG: DUF3775 domain-containing protein [Candidatus Binataceae bacterium]